MAAQLMLEWHVIDPHQLAQCCNAMHAYVMYNQLTLPFEPFGSAGEAQFKIEAVSKEDGQTMVSQNQLQRKLSRKHLP